MWHEKQRLNYVLFLVATGSGLVTIARATTLSFLAIKLQQSFRSWPGHDGWCAPGDRPLVGAVRGSFRGLKICRIGWGARPC